MKVSAGELKKKSNEIRKTMLEMCIRAGTGHVTSSLSCIDILVALYHGRIMKYDPANPDWDERDRFILSKGQASPALYTVLADTGFFDPEKLNKFAQKDGSFGVHLQHDVPGVEITSGSLGQGFGVAAGIALGAKMNRNLYLVFTLLGDGECYEGSIWETAMFAAHNRLNNLIAIVDRNYLCVTDFTENLIALEPMEDKWKSFGWDVLRINGHSIECLVDSLSNLRSRRANRPLVIIADTVKGEGVECITNNPVWHGISPKGEEAETARLCLERSCGNE
ncbi:MAG: transketolase [Nitrospirae bacterium]|nr:transketolase [Nitrospirota bacterium]